VSSASDIEKVSNRVIGCAIEVHRIMGPGLLESVYRECLLIELKEHMLRAESECPVPLKYKGHGIHTELKLDVLVEGCVIVELKAVERVHPVHARRTSP
jgi:GxxExxY protein